MSSHPIRFTAYQIQTLRNLVHGGQDDDDEQDPDYSKALGQIEAKLRAAAGKLRMHA